MAANVQTLRFRRPTTGTPAPAEKEKPKGRHEGILQDQIRRHERKPWNPGFSVAVRILFMLRFCAAIYSNISDCDEVYNFWEPLHYLDQGHGFQTWETSPVYAIRSYAYILLHWAPVRVAQFIAREKRASFFAVRILLALASTLCEVKLYRVLVDKINVRVGRYFFFMLLFNTGMWNAAPAFLPSSFAMYANTLAFAYAVEPANSGKSRRTLAATIAFAAGAIIGWPFALVVAAPFVFEELFMRGLDHVPADAYAGWMFKRWQRLVTAGATAALIFMPVIAIDSLFYGRLTITPWNIVKYNVFPDSARGPNLYGTEPWYYYLLNLTLNFNVLLPLALASLPALAVTHTFDYKRLGAPGAKDQGSAYTTLACRLAPVYVWLGLLSMQAHKEERFMYPIYPLICFNAAVSLYLMRGWLEKAYVKLTTPYQASRTSMFRNATFSVLVYTGLVSVSRILALWHNYHAPFAAISHLSSHELPRLLNVTGLLPPPLPHARTDEAPSVDLRPIADFGLRLCVGKEWHRFPGSFLVPFGVDMRFVKSEFDGLVPGRFHESGRSAGWLTRVAGTSTVPVGQNDLNREDLTHYVDISTCDYLLDLDFPEHPRESALEPRYAAGHPHWERVFCQPFLDAQHSSILTRTLWLPGARWRSRNSYGDYCLLRSATLERPEGKVGLIKARKDASV